MKFAAVADQARKVWLAAAIAFLVGTGTVVSMSAIVPGVSAAQSTADLDAEGLAANQAWWGALVTGTVAAVDAVLAPEFQIMRADGSSYDKEDYLGSRLPVVVAIPEFSQMVVTAHEDLLVTRYYVSVQETRDGQTVEAHAPRLTVFRKDGDTWLVSAHANFATLEK
jgi:ketosteroid isomerase-like protein